MNVDILAEGLLREFIARRGFKRTRDAFEQDCPRTEDAISSRQIMAQILGIEGLFQKKKERHGKQMPSCLEILAEKIIRSQLEKEIAGSASDADNGDRDESRVRELPASNAALARRPNPPAQATTTTTTTAATATATAAGNPKPKQLKREDFLFMNRTDETLFRRDGDIAGQQFVIDSAERCSVFLLDYSSQISVDFATDCDIVVGPCDGSVFLRDCKNCTLHVACRQFRTRDCLNCTIFLYCQTEPIIETSSTLTFAPWNVCYNGQKKHFAAAHLDVQTNLWNKIFDFSNAGSSSLAAATATATATAADTHLATRRTAVQNPDGQSKVPAHYQLMEPAAFSLRHLESSAEIAVPLPDDFPAAGAVPNGRVQSANTPAAKSEADLMLEDIGDEDMEDLGGIDNNNNNNKNKNNKNSNSNKEEEEPEEEEPEEEEEEEDNDADAAPSVLVSGSRLQQELEREGEEISPSEARDIQRMLTGPNKSVPESWRLQQFKFEALAPNQRFGLVQDEGGPCGVLAAVQAQFIIEVVFAAKMPVQTLFTGLTGSMQREYLAKSLCRMLFRMNAERVVVALGRNTDFTSWRKVEFSSADRLVDFLKKICLGHFTVLCLVVSAMLTRGLGNMGKDMDDLHGGGSSCSLQTLITNFMHGSQELVNLLMTGRAVSNVFDGEVEEVSGAELKGIATQSDIGFLTPLEKRGLLMVGENLKYPKYPVWVVFFGSHYSVLFAGLPIRYAMPPKAVDLYYYDGLARHDDLVRLSLTRKTAAAAAASTATATATATETETEFDLEPPLESCIHLSVFDDYSIDWNGTERLL